MYYQIIVFTQTVFWTKSLKTIKMLLLTETRVERQQNNEGQSDVWRGGGDCPEGHMSGHCGDEACTHDQTGIRTKINRRRRRRRRLAGRDSTQVPVQRRRNGNRHATRHCILRPRLQCPSQPAQLSSATTQSVR